MQPFPQAQPLRVLLHWSPGHQLLDYQGLFVRVTDQQPACVLNLGSLQGQNESRVREEGQQRSTRQDRASSHTVTDQQQETTG